MRKGLRALGGKVAVITGAANGIGRALTLGLWAKGCSVALLDLSAEGLADLEASLSPNRDGQRVSTHIVDVGDKAAMEAAAREVAQTHGAIHLLINNAGIAYEASFPQTPLEAWERMISVNVWGVIYGCHFFMPYLAKVERAHIVNLSSLFGILGMAGQTAYCTTKFAVRGLSESLWEELRATTIGLTVVHPGGVATQIIRSAQGDDPELLERLGDFYERRTMSPHKAAAKIIGAIEKGKPRLLIAPEATFGDLIKRLWPVRGNKFMGDVMIRVLGEEGMRAKRLEQWRETMVEGDPSG